MPPPESSAHVAGPRLLVVDDDPDIRSLLSRYFGTHGFAVEAAADGAAMRDMLAAAAVDLVLLDLGLPGQDGLELMRQLRAEHDCAVIIVTGRGDSIDRVVGLELGADDYVAKPFELRELLARVRSVLRRTATAPTAPPPAREASGDRFEFDGWLLDLGARRLLDPQREERPLTHGEFELLQAFVEQPNRVLSRDALMNRLHGRDAGPYDRAIDVQVGRLRKKLESDPGAPQLIKAIRGAGYLFAGKVRRV